MVTFCIFDAVYNTRKGNLVKECHIEAFREEYVGFTAVAIGVGRMTGYVLMLLVSLANNLIFFKILLAVITLFAPVYGFLMRRTEVDS